MKILVIDDERDIRQLVAYALKQEGFEVTEAGTIEDAAQKIMTDEWDIIISDVMIPHLGGFELVELAKVKRNIPVILLTGVDKDILYSTHTWADLILTKPVSRKQLLDSVRSLCAPAGTV